MKRFPYPLRFVPCLAAASWFALGGSCFAEKDWAYGGGPLPTASSAEKNGEPGESAKVAGAPETFREIAGMMESLFAAGWADPRGREYRELTIPGEADGGEFKYPTTFRIDGSPILENQRRQKIRGWLLPKVDGNEQRYAVAWDGLVYPVIEIGPPMDLGADVKAALGEKKVTPFSGKVGMAADRVSLAKVVLLLRLGMKTEAAEMAGLWEEAATVADDDYKPEVYTILTTEWLGTQFARARWAHCAGRSKLALAYLEPIPKARAKVEEDARRFGVHIGEPKEVPGWGKDLELSFLNQIPALIADEQRRIEEGVTSRPEIADPKSVADKAKRIALLIRDLEEVDAHPLMSKGYIDFTLDPVVKALVAQGEDAVEPLIDALANDHRLTKTVDGGRGWWDRWQPWRTRIVGAEEPALAALVGIFRSRDQLPSLDVPYVNYGPMDPKLKRAELAKVIQAYWEKYRGKPLVERWYGLLADDDAMPRAWAEAAENLTLRESQPVQVYGEQLFERAPEPGQPDPMRGEVLRHRAEPSVSLLMAKRFRDAYALGRESEELHRAVPGTVFDPGKRSADPFPMIPVEKLAKALAVWDGPKQLETFRWYSGELEKKVAEQKDLRERGSMDELIRTYIARKKAGDGKALADYGKWVPALDAKKYSGSELKFFAPLWVFPGDPALAEVSRRLFLDPASPWRPGAAGVNPGWIAGGADTPLVAVPEYRALLLEQLENQLVVGSVELKPEEKGSSEIVRLPWPADESKSAPAPLQDLRLCDLIADRLTRVRGVPEFTPHWPKDKRDKAIVQISAFVRQYGGRWSRRPDYPPDDMTSLQAELKFPPLERPATKKDVENGLAIFSNEGAPDRRLWTLPEIPVQHSPMPGSKTKARWITYQEDSALNLDGSTAYNQEVDVWQAEDALVAGQWKRTFGVVAKNRMAVVPGEEIEFNSFSKSDGWQAGFSLEGSVPNKNELPAIKIGAPAIMKVSLRNLRGEPRAFDRNNEISGIPAMKDLHMTVRLKYFTGSFEAFRQAGLYPAWKPLEEHGEAVVEMLPTPQAIETLKDAALLKFDLAQMFDLSAPGVYRMELLFSKGGLFEEDKSAWGPMFEVKE